MKAHKIILSLASDYFRGAFEGGFQEAGKDELVLHGDDAGAMMGIIAWIYGSHYDGTGSRSDEWRSAEEAGLQYVR